MKFTKMHGAGNDYIFVNCFEEKVKNPAGLARTLSDRHTGIGSDGLILICPSKKADVKMRIFNADGSQAEMCGNGIRCVAKFVYEHNLARPSGSLKIPQQPAFPLSLKIETGSGILTVGLLPDKKNKIQKVCVNMGRPLLRPKDIPVLLKGSSVINKPIIVLGQKLLMTCVSMGNPHAVFFCDNVKKIELNKIGPAIERLKIFPKRANVHFVEVKKINELSMRTWERGSGLTQACGTGACAACVAAVLTGKCSGPCTIHVPGGSLDINWSKKDGFVYMTGPAVEVFEGSIQAK